MSSYNKVGGRYGMHSGSGRFKNLQVDNNAWVRGMPLIASQGNVIFVDSNVTTSGNGNSWDTAMSTITLAVAAAERYDTILVAGTVNQDSAEALTSDYDEAVVIPATKMGLKIIGCGNSPEGIAWNADADEVCLTVNARDCYISGFRFRPDGATTGVGIAFETDSDMANNAMGSTVENCIFRSTGTTALAGITIDGSNDITIRNCKFTSVLTGILSISPGHSIQYRTIIEDCFFDDKCTNGIDVDMRSGLIKNCVIMPGLTMALATNKHSVGKENMVMHNLIAATAYETNCAGYSTDIWNSSFCSDVGNTDVSADGAIIAYPSQS